MAEDSAEIVEKPPQTVLRDQVTVLLKEHENSRQRLLDDEAQTSIVSTILDNVETDSITDVSCAVSARKLIDKDYKAFWPDSDRLLATVLFSEIVNAMDDHIDDAVLGKVSTVDVDGFTQAAMQAQIWHSNGTSFSSHEALAVLRTVIKNSRKYRKEDKKYLQDKIDSFLVSVPHIMGEYLLNNPNRDHRSAFAVRYLTLGPFFELLYDLSSVGTKRTQKPVEYLSELRSAAKMGYISQIYDDIKDLVHDVGQGVNPLSELISQKAPELIDTLKLQNIVSQSPVDISLFIETEAQDIYEEYNRLCKIMGLSIPDWRREIQQMSRQA